MAERRAFPDFHFKPYRPFDLRVEPAVPIRSKLDITPLVVPLGSPIPPDSSMLGRRDRIGVLTTTEREPMTSEWLLQIFTRQLSVISDSIGQPLPMENVTFEFVSDTEIHNRTEEEKEYLRKRYGEYVIDGTAGSCTRHDDGTFTIRINENLLEDDPSGDRAIEVMAHEYGHTLGDELENAVDEELKANAFENLFMKFYLDVDYYSNFDFHTNTVHQQSRYRMDLLTTAIPDTEAIIAHLIGSSFGNFDPDDYVTYLSPRFRKQQTEIDEEDNSHTIFDVNEPGESSLEELLVH